jgi:hypothetical protein
MAGLNSRSQYGESFLTTLFVSEPPGSVIGRLHLYEHRETFHRQMIANSKVINFRFKAENLV